MAEAAAVAAAAAVAEARPAVRAPRPFTGKKEEDFTVFVSRLEEYYRLARIKDTEKTSNLFFT